MLHFVQHGEWPGEEGFEIDAHDIEHFKVERVPGRVENLISSGVTASEVSVSMNSNIRNIEYESRAFLE